MFSNNGKKKGYTYIMSEQRHREIKILCAKRGISIHSLFEIALKKELSNINK